MKTKLTILFITFFILNLEAQPNCNWYKYQGDLKKYEACVASEKRAGHYQFSREFQTALDEALLIDSTFAYAYRAKSTAYLKSGDFITWMELMEKAVEYDPIESLEYRGWCRLQFFRDYQGAIDDILRLKELTNDQIGYSVNADYHLDIALALCYKSLGQTDLAIQIIQEKFSDTTYTSGLYDHLHLGVLYLEKGEFPKAIEQLKVQEGINDLAENRFYIAIAYKALQNEEKFYSNLTTSKAYYQKNQKLFDTYVEYIDKIYIEDILKEEEYGIRGQIPPNSGYVIRRY